nr:unnamed protein product [Callosobruchus chinensis]
MKVWLAIKRFLTRVQQILMRHSEQRERARILLEQARKDSSSPTSPSKSEEERQAQLRERARKLLAEARRGSGPTTEIIRVSPGSVKAYIEAAGKLNRLDNDLAPLERQPSSGSENNGNVYTSNLMNGRGDNISYKTSPSDINKDKERITPDKLPDELGLKEMGIDVHTWIDKEMEDLEREQRVIDEQAAILEKQLRDVMESKDSNGDEEEALMAKWFMFVNKKNALLRRQMQLNILEKEADLETRYKMLNLELQKIASIEDWRKTEEQRNREQALLDELVQIVNKRDELVHHLDNQEKARPFKGLNTICISNPLTQKYFKSETAVNDEKVRQIELNCWYIVHPLSKLRICFEVWQLVLYSTMVIIKPMNGALPKAVTMRMPFFPELCTMLDLLSWLTILFTFFNGYIIDRTNTIILEPKRIAWHYVSSAYFTCDVLSSIPVFPVIHFWEILRGSRRVVFIGILYALCELKVVRIVSVINNISHLAIYLRIKARESIFLLMCMLVMTFTVHNCTILQLLVPKLVRIYFTKDVQANLTWYAKSAIHLDLYTDNGEEDIVLALVTYIVGKIIICTTYVVLAVTLLSNRSMKVKFQSIICELNQYMKQKELPLDLQRRIRSYYNFKYQGKYFKEGMVHDMLSDKLKTEVNLHVCRSLLQNVSILADLTPDEVTAVVTLLTPEIFLPKDTIMQSGCYGACMYFISSGTVAVYTHSDRIIALLPPVTSDGSGSSDDENIPVKTLDVIENSDSDKSEAPSVLYEAAPAMENIMDNLSDTDDASEAGVIPKKQNTPVKKYSRKFYTPKRSYAITPLKTRSHSKPKKIEKSTRNSVDIPEDNFTTPDKVKTPYEYFLMFFSDDLVEMAVDNTNLYSVQETGKSISFTVDEMRDFLAIQILMEIVEIPAYTDYWSQKFGYNDIAEVMPLKRYQQIRRYIHFVNNANQNDDPYLKIRPALEIVRRNCIAVEEEKKQSIDEMMIPYKGKKVGSKRQYIKSKPNRWGFKIFVRAGVSGIVYDFVVYGGEKTLKEYHQFTSEEDSLGLGAKIWHLQDGDYFGEVSMVMKTPYWTVTVIAIETTQVYRLKRKDFIKYMLRNQKVLKKVQRVASKRFLVIKDYEMAYKKMLFEQAHRGQYAESDHEPD